MRDDIEPLCKGIISMPSSKIRKLLVYNTPSIQITFHIDLSKVIFMCVMKLVVHSNSVCI